MLVHWQMSCDRDDADNPVTAAWLAAEQAWHAMRGADSIANVFTVVDDDGRTWLVDLTEDTVDQTQPTVVVRFLPGDGHEYRVDVAYLADFPRGPGGACAFCNGDPCDERPVAGSHIHTYYLRNPSTETCPMCDGRPT